MFDRSVETPSPGAQALPIGIVGEVIQAARAQSLEALLEQIARISRRVVRARYAALGVPDAGGGLRFFKTDGMPSDAVARIEHPPHGHGLIGAILREGRAIRLDRMTDDPRAAGFPAHHPVMVHLLGVPIRDADRLYGVLYLCDREDDRPFDAHDEEIIAFMAGYAAVAIASAESAERQRRLELLEERERIGMALHDGVIQSLYAIGMYVEVLRSQAGSGVSEDLASINEGLNRVIDDIRGYIRHLRTAEMPTVSLQSCIESNVARLLVPTGIRISVEATDDLVPLDSSGYQAICLLLQEAMSNALRHAGAAHIHVRAWVHDRKIHLVVMDDGCGFLMGELGNHDGLGIRNMMQRVHLHGGVIEIDSRPRRGTTVSIAIPCQG
jgi:signal transduction histidine kinase